MIRRLWYKGVATGLNWEKCPRLTLVFFFLTVAVVKRQSNHGSRILLAPELGGMKLGKCEGDVLLKFERHFPIVIFDGELIFDVIFTIRVNVHG